jgi:acyl carrier protein
MSKPNPNLITKAPRTQESIQAWLVEQFAEQLQLESDQIDIKEPFDSYDLSSSQALIIAGKAEKQFGFKLSPILLWHYPSIESLSHRLVEEFATTEQVFEI